jgi:glycerol-1-phosphate dehydrogenase [NAD(P)+]
VAKYIGIADWQIANLLTDEYYCPAVAKITMTAVEKMVALADRVTGSDEDAAGAIMEALVLSGIAMKLALCSRPASGAEHVVSHYWECYKVARGIWPEFHGKKVGVATLIINKIYRNMASRIESIEPHADNTDWDDVYAHFSSDQIPEVKKLNTPTITDKIDLERFKDSWQEIRRIINDILPDNDTLYKLMKMAGCATEIEEIHVSPELLCDGLHYHSYMRYRVLLTRLMPMIDVDPMDYID